MIHISSCIISYAVSKYGILTAPHLFSLYEIIWLCIETIFEFNKSSCLTTVNVLSDEQIASIYYIRI